MHRPSCTLQPAGAAPAGLRTRSLAFALALACIEAMAQEKAAPGDCGNPFVNSYGPFDYRTATAEQRKLVESFHFSGDVESLRAGLTGPIGGDIDYTLRAFPNHPRALNAMVRLGARERALTPRGARYTVECYIERARAFTPDDLAVRQIRGVYLSSIRRYDDAIAELQAVLEIQPENANAQYNLGLAYLEKKDYDKALVHAKRASALGFPLEGLKRRLKAAGKWVD